MLLDWIRIDLTLVVESPLAIGTGRLLKGESADVGGIAAVQLGADGYPCIPATSLKGALRAATPDAALRERSFGDIGKSDGSGIAGRLMLGAAMWDANATRLRNEIVSTSNDPTFDRPATAIDRSSGAVARGKLFTQRAVKRGAAFTLTGRLQCDLAGANWNETLKTDIAELGAVLAPLLPGLALGKGTRLGYGRVRLDPEHSTFHLVRYDPDTGLSGGLGEDISRRVHDAIRRASSCSNFLPLYTLKLGGVSPFIIVDPTPARVQAEEGVYREETAPVIAGDGKPMLWPSSLLGVLRSRASWIAEIDRLRSSTKGDPAKFVPADRDLDHAADDRFLEHVLGSGRRAVESVRDLERLSSVERLFGVPGWKGALVVSSLECTSAGAKRKRTNVAIDRLTGGAKDGALFVTNVVEGAAFTVGLDLAYGARRIGKKYEKIDRELLEELLDALKEDGLVLGHAAARGFGRFDVTWESAA